MSVQQEKFKKIADTIRAHLGTNDLIKPNDFANSIDMVTTKVATDNLQAGYEAGYSDGEEIGYTDGWYDGNVEGEEQGRQAQYDEFWDTFQGNGKRTNYNYAFQRGWSVETFKPKYDIRPTGTGGQNMFNAYENTGNVDLRKEALGVEFDFSKCTSFINTFGYQNWIKAIGTIDTTGATGINGAGLNGSDAVHTIEKIILKDDGSQTGLTFNYLSSLKNITFEGCIGTDFSMPHSPLTKESIMGKPITSEEYEVLSESVKTYNVIVIDGVYYYGGVITALKSDATGKTLTLKKTAVNSAFGINVDDETTYPEGSEYYTLRHSRDNWNISYV